MTADELASKIEHTLLRPDATEADVIRLCAEAAEHNFYGVCVNPYWVLTAKLGLVDRRSDAKVVSVVGFPFGATEASVKAVETRRVVDSGADEVDMVINVGAMRGGEAESIIHEIEMVVKAANSKPVKVILECCYLTDEEKVRAAKIAMEAGAAFVKTSTGYGPGGATLDDVRLLKRTVGERVGVKAAGGIRNLATALAMLAAGADRLGCSASVAIMLELVLEGRKD